MRHKAILIAISAVLTVASAGIIPTVEVIQGPGSRTILHGPDGSALKAAIPGPAWAVNGPAGSIESSYTLGGPAVVPGIAPVHVDGKVAGSIAPGAASVLTAVAEEGAYVQDNLEALYDDGSYREY
nr:unnamed protein product [Callosobruchus analis]